MKISENFRALTPNYLFAEVAARVAAFKAEHPQKNVISLGIGDVTLPLPECVVQALRAAAEEMGEQASFRGYGPEQGYGFLREAIAGYYAGKGVKLNTGEIFVSDGAKSDLGNILDIFPRGMTVAVPDPVYPAYVDANIISGNKTVFVKALPENGFLPLPDKSVKADVIYICSPNNPTGAVYDAEKLRLWVEHALATGALIIYDAAYERFITDKALPTTVYSVPGAEYCAIEVCSFSKTAGFTGLRCGWTVVPETLAGGSVNAAWLRRQCVKFNGVPYVVQRAAQAVLTPEGLRAADEHIAYYLENARLIAGALREKGVRFFGGENSPYIWMECGMPSWEFFDQLLDSAQIVGTPGAGFGSGGEGFFRLTAFNSRENTLAAAERIKRL